MIKNLFLNDRFILGLIVLNSVVIFVTGFVHKPETLFYLQLTDHIITWLFVAETVIKIKTYKGEYFNSNWNRFDFGIIILSLPSLLAFYAHITDVNLSILLVLRVFRVFKTLRFFRFVPGLNHLLDGIIRALKASIVAILGFLMYVFIIGIFSYYIFQDISPEYFGNPGIALYSIFKVFTIEGWFDIPELITANLNNTAAFFTYLYFVFILLTGGIIGLSLVNSIFVDAMVSDNNDALEEKVDNLNKKIDILITEARDGNNKGEKS